MKIKSCFYITLLLGLLLPMQAYAILIFAGHFDKLIQKAEIVIKAQVVPQEETPFEKIAFKAEIISILKSDGGPIPENLSLESAISVWPKDFGVPFEEKQVVLLVLRRVKGKLAVVNNLRAILPATILKICHKSHNTIIRKVFDELHAFLPQAKDEVSQALVLVHLSHLASKTDEKIFLPYAKSKDKWLRRAALASLLRVNPTTERIQAAVADFENHLSKPSNDRLFWEMYKDVQWVSRCGAWGMEKNMTTRAITYLPIYRVLIDKAFPHNKKVYIGIEALKNIGGREDIYRLYKYLNDKKASIRHDVLEGLGRILGMKIKRPSIPSYEIPENLTSDIEVWEKEMRTTIKKALIDEGLLEK